jgi:hypothetical protein
MPGEFPGIPGTRQSSIIHAALKKKNQKPITQRTDLSQENLDTMAQTATLIVVITTVTNRKTSPFYPPVNFLIYATRSSRILAPWIICANLQIPNTTP